MAKLHECTNIPPNLKAQAQALAMDIPDDVKAKLESLNIDWTKLIAWLTTNGLPALLTIIKILFGLP